MPSRVRVTPIRRSSSSANPSTGCQPASKTPSRRRNHGDEAAIGSRERAAARIGPYDDGEADLAHLRNALARIPQSNLPSKVKEQATAAADHEVAKSRAVLRAEAAQLAVTLAEETLRQQFNKGDQDRLVGDYLSKVVELH